MKKIYLLIFILLSFLLFLLLNLKTPIKIQGDGVFYYSWLHSILFDFDLDFSNELKYYSSYDSGSRWFIEKNILTPTGQVPNAYAFGSAIIWAPFVIMAHLLSNLLADINPVFSSDGFSYIYNFAVNFASWACGCLAIYLNYLILKRYFAKKIMFLTLAGIYLATPWFYYQYFEPAMSHIISLFLVSCYWYLLIKLQQKEPVSHWLFSIITFLMLAVRWQNLIFCLAYLPIIWHERTKFKIFTQKIFLLMAPIVAFWLLQIIIWQKLYGSYLLIPQGYHFIYLRFYGLYTLFSSDHGLLLWSPIIIFCIWGLFFLGKQSKYLAVTVGMVFFSQWLLNSLLNDPGGGDAFGGRRFLETLPFLMLGLSGFITRLKRFYKPIFIIIVFLICWNFLLLENYRLGTIPHSGKFNFWQINYGQVINRDFNKFIISK